MLKVKYREEVGKWETRIVLEIWHKDKLLAEHYDNGEPEDSSFYRDWNWIAGALAEAYKLGVKDALGIT